MKIIKNVARVIVYNQNEKKILLVRNKNASFWYAPGGGWEPENENIIECAKREVFEETGLNVEIGRLLYVQQFNESENVVYFETFWLGVPLEGSDLNEQHVDLDVHGQVEESRWFNKEDASNVKIFPDRLKNTFWDNIQNFLKEENPFIGIQ